ncbi:50S ribosomal protein L15e [Candidatus Woesearchaeota archaeon]|nr:50S ribosomal protein L15e [Candidatus Woesearchaeota archaeon]
MSLYSQVKQLWKKPKESLGTLVQERLVTWREGNSVVRIERPTRIDRARSLGYKAKQGYVLARVRLGKSNRQRPKIRKGRRSKHMRRKKIVGKSYQWIAEERAQKKYPNCEILNSYQIGVDGTHKFYEVILVDRELVSKYKDMKWLKNTSGRVYRGLTSAGRKSRGLAGKGKGYEKVRPSLRAHRNRGKS